MNAVRPRRRWHRVAVPFLVLGLLFLVTGVAFVREEPDLGDPGTMAPGGTGPDGSSELAALLAAEGVTIHRVTRSSDALATLDRTGRAATIFVPAPHFASPLFFGALAELPGRHRVVLVRPAGLSALASGFVPRPARWAARVAEPGCAVAASAGRATVLRSRYATDPTLTRFSCYEGAVVAADVNRTQVVAVGATEPFRNARLGEAGNAALATLLLSRDRDLVWLDLHQREPFPRPPLELPKYQQPERAGGGTENPLWTAFPPVLWASLVALAVLASLVAVVRARRLGPPVSEPLPVVVPATETVLGRGRLYRRVRSRAETFAALRDAALRRLLPPTRPAADPVSAGQPAGPGPLSQPAGPGPLSQPAAVPADVVARVAELTGQPATRVDAILNPPAPRSDSDLAEAVAHLDVLVNEVLPAQRWAGPNTIPAPQWAEPNTIPAPRGPVDPGGTP